MLTAALFGARVAAGTAAFAALTAWTADAAAQPAAKKTIAVRIDGTDAAEVRKAVIAAAPEGVTVVEPRAFDAALRKAGQSKLGNLLSTKKGRDKVLGRVRKAMKEVKADAAVLGVVQRWKGKPRVYLVWVNADDEDLPFDEGVEIAGGDDARDQAIASALEPSMKKLAPPAAADTKPAGADVKADAAGDKPGEDEDDDDDETPTEGRVRHEAGSSIFAVELGFEVGGRQFDYSDGLSPDTRRDYGVFGAPMASIALEVYPAAGTDIPVLKHLGITGSYARAFGLSSSTEGGEPAPTTYQRISAGLRGRIPFSGPKGPVLGINGGIRMVTFEIEEPALLAGEVPDVDYFALRGGIDGVIPIGRVSILAGFDWLEPLKTGEVYGRFREASVHGIGAMAGVGVRIAGGFEVRLLGEYSRFFSDFNPVLGDPHVAGGALDQFFGIRLAGAYVE
ncbi:hypothetical protein [Polyangium aurulentum]|uniref:hypothetical protein n=1 Tax=Polyangium aurulentum TaxID=2567896 RepID=UPI0010ADC1B8|nr:hypothetical protein [Polyangium aurulentum]UQA58180.1 hypothetical protein E8A73_044165 [Polyangium aurulentum]